MKSDIVDDVWAVIRATGSIGGGVDRSPSHYSGEKALYLAVLEDGIRCCLSAWPAIRKKAEIWVSRRRNKRPFTFVYTCDVLGLEPNAVLGAIARLQARTEPGKRVRIRSRENVRKVGMLLPRKSPTKTGVKKK